MGARPTISSRRDESPFCRDDPENGLPRLSRQLEYPTRRDRNSAIETLAEKLKYSIAIEYPMGIRGRANLAGHDYRHGAMTMPFAVTTQEWWFSSAVTATLNYLSAVTETQPLRFCLKV